MIKSNKRFDVKWLIAPAIVVVWMLIIYCVKGVYPFGDSSLISYDLRAGGMPFIYYLNDVWHSGDLTKLLYDFNTAAGFPRSAIFSIVHPVYLYCLFFSREFLPHAIDLFFIFQFGFTAFTASYSFSKLFSKLSPAHNVLISVMYAFNGFSIMYLTNIDWLEIVMLYPLLIVFAINLVNGKSKVPFFLLLSYMMSFCTYMAFFVVVSLVIFGGLYIYVVLEKEKRKKAVLDLGIGAGASLIASSHFIYKYAASIFSTARFNMGTYVRDSYSGEVENVSGFVGILKAPAEIDMISVFMFLGTALAIASLIVMWVHFKKYKQSRKYTIFFTLVIILLLCQVIFKATMLYWHMGSYQFFPFRNGYMVSFFCCCIIGYYFGCFSDVEGIKTEKNVLKFITLIPIFICALVIASYVDVFTFNLDAIFGVLNSSVAYQTNGMAYPYTCLAVAVIVCFLFIKLVSFKTLRNILTFVLVFIMLGINSFSFLSDSIAVDRSDAYYNELESSEMLTQNDALSRACNTDYCLMINYPYIANVHAISNWTHSLSGNHLKSFVDLGFCSNFTHVKDMGGTVFSRALLRITETIAGCELDNRLYEKTGETESGINYYKNRYSLPAGICSNKEIEKISVDDYKDLFEYQNAIYSAMGGDGNLFSKVEYEDSTKTVEMKDFYYNKENEATGEMGVFVEKKGFVTVKYKIDIKDEAVLYLHNSEKNRIVQFVELQIDGKPFHVYNGEIQEDGKSYNKAYSQFDSNGILELGVFENETIEVSIMFNEDYKTDEAAVMYLMDTGKMKKLCQDKSGVDYAINNSQITLNVNNKDNDELVFVPISFSEKWICTVNDQKVEPTCVLGNFMGIKINEGENVISLNFSRTDAYSRISIFILTFLIGLALVIFERKIKFPRSLQTFAFIVFSLIFAAGVTVLYILPVGYNLMTVVTSLFK